MIFTACLILVVSAETRAADRIPKADILLTGGTVFDGTGSVGQAVDVAILGDRIVAIGDLEVDRVGQKIDCSGLVIAPGFIDLHNHSDNQIIHPRTRANMNYLTQGCTTVVTGNCGSGPVNVGSYYEQIDKHGAGTNVAHLLPQGALRNAVMGTADRKANAQEIKNMRALVGQAMADGAWGMSTGLIYVPSSYADIDELVEIAKVVSQSKGIYVSHIRNENIGVLTAVHEALNIGRRANLPVHISHFKSSGRESWGLVRRAAEMIETARAAGMVVTADQYPYIASSTSLDATLIPTWARAGGREELIKRFNDPLASSRIRSAMIESLRKREDGAVLQIARYAPRPDFVGRNLLEIARSEKTDPLSLAVEIAKNGGASIVNFCMDEQDIRYIMKSSWVATASDGRAYLPGSDQPHPRSYGTFSKKIGHYAIREKVISLQHALRTSTGLPADILGMTDRGYLKKTFIADIVVFDSEEFIDLATFKKPHQYSAGVKYVFVNGEVAIFNGQATGALAGRALRHKKTSLNKVQQPAPMKSGN